MKLYAQNTKLDRSNILKAKIAVFGLGKMGLPLAVVFAHRGFDVTGVDINAKVAERVNAGKNPIYGEKNLSDLLMKAVEGKKFRATTDGILASSETDIKIIIVPTFLNEKKEPDLNIIKNVAVKIGKGLKKGDIVILESTAPPGTTRNVIGRILEKESKLKLNKDFSIAHCPERTNSGSAIADITGRINPKIIGASDRKTTRILKMIYGIINKKGVVAVRDLETAEMVKISEMVYRDVKIAYANTLALICDQLKISAKELIAAANTDAGCEILNPGPGVGGHCIPVYPYFVFSKVKNKLDLLKSARHINDSMSTYVIKLASEALEEKGKKLKDSNVLILGISYRGGVKETRLSPGIKICKEISKKCRKVFVFDPLFTEREAIKMGLKYKKDFRDIDCIIITAEHDQFRKINWKKVAEEIRTRTIVDGKSSIDASKLKRMDFSVRRIGYAE